MKLSKKNIELILNTPVNFQLCDNSIFLMFFNKLKNVDFEKIDSEKSFIEIVDENDEILNVNIENANLANSNKNYSYSIKLISKKNKAITIVFDIWNSYVNIYLGKHLIHYADDFQIKTQKKLNEFDNYLSTLMESKVTEELHYKKTQLKKVIYSFQINQKEKTFKFSFGFPRLFTTTNKIIKNTFQPWENKIK